ncbi:ABC transporter transmembrane domain-containing protein [Oceanivirga salmonicida]|uniref:ABC transporter transmembrane domain-containing protein n=1 Tax=Oceanivirga salmonicida TaxID=1769291 RepID=UPI0012E31FAF|nr:ABC transporter ATP-binding protein [Oceanivirga salmonicida]
MKKIMGKYKYLFLLSIITSLVFSVSLTLFSLQLGNIIDAINKDANILIYRLLLATLFLIISVAFLIIYSYLSNNYSIKILNHTKKELYNSYYNIELENYNKNKNAEYLNLFTKDMDLLIDNYLKPKLTMFTEIFRAFFSMIAILYISWRLAIAFILVSMINILFSSLPSKYMLSKTNEFSSANKEYLHNTTNYISGFEQIKLLGIGKIFKNKLNNIDDNFEKARFKYLFAKDFSSYFAMSLGLISQMLCLSIGIFLAIKGYLTIGMLIAAIQLLNSIFTPISNISKYRNLIKTQKKIINNIDNKLSEKYIELENIDNKITKIDIKDLSLNFNNKVVFDKYNYTFISDKKYAIIGESGRGKSTLIKLIMKYFSNKEYTGSITINDKNINDINSNSIYSRIGFIQKNDFILDENIENNILLGRENIDISNVVDILNLNTIMNKDEDNIISSGEKQRIDISRFIVSDYDVLIFDEPTSNLDPETSRKVENYILGLKDKIVIVITHNQNEELLNEFDEIIKL